MSKLELDAQISQCEVKALRYYQQRLDASIRKNFAAGVTHWLARIHELEDIINERHASSTRQTTSTTQ